MIAKGYKQTEIGVIPKDWGVVSFADVADKNIRWSITGGPFGSNLKTDDYTNSGVQIIQLQNIGDGKFIDKSVVFTSLKKAKELLGSNIYPGELILSKMGDPVTRACIIPNKADRFLMASDGIRLVVDKNKFDKGFVLEYINSKYFRNRAIDVSTGTTRQRIGLPELKNLGFIKPTLKEQEAIAKVLTDTDNLIQGIEDLIAKKKAIKKGAMQQLLTPPNKGGKRLPGFSGEWETNKLKNISSFRRGSFPQPYGLDKWYDDVSGMPFIQVVDVAKNKKLKAETKRKISELGAEYSVFVKKGTVVLTIQGSIGRICITQYDAYIDRTLLIFQSILDVFDKYMFMMLVDQKFEIEKEKAPGGIIKTITKEALSSFEISYPSTRKEQEAIATILSDMDKEIEALETKKEKYIQIKKGLAQDLLTGKTRLV